MKILFAAPQQGYTEELLLYGLTEVLGTQVVDYPRMDHLWGPPKTGGLYSALSGLLHGQDEPNRAKLQQRVADGEFDLLVVSNRSWQHIPQAAYQKIPCIFVDGEDDADHVYASQADSLGFRLYFKRECYIEDDHIRALPFSYPECLSFAPSPDRPLDVFGIYGVNHWPREQVVWALQKEHPNVRLMDINKRVWATNAEYLDMLRQSKIGIDVRGFGWGTLRHWEIVANGCLLFRQRLPIYVPNDYEDGVDCFEFATIIGLSQCLRYYCGDGVVQSMSMRERSFARYLRYHTTKARAEQFLAACEEVL